MMRAFIGLLFSLGLSVSSVGPAYGAATAVEDFWTLGELTQLCTDGTRAVVCPPESTPDTGGGDGPLVTPWTTEFAGTYLTQVEGFTAIPPPTAVDREVYVSTSTGSDANNCLSAATACATVEKGSTLLRDGYSDRLLLKRGDVFRLVEYWSNVYKDGRSATEPTVIAPYGSSGPRPVVTTSDRWVAGNVGDARNIIFSGLEFYFEKHDPDSPNFTAGIGEVSSLRHIGEFVNLTWDDCHFHHGELVIQAWDGRNPANIRLNRNIFDELYSHSTRTTNSSRPSGMFLSGVSDLKIVENTIWLGGWTPRVRDQFIAGTNITGAGPNMYNHGAYLTNNLTGELEVHRNISIEASSYGIMNRSGGKMSGNFIAGATTGLATIGYGSSAAEQPPSGIQTRVFDNVIVEGVPMSKHEPDYYCSVLCTPAVYGLTLSPDIVSPTVVDIIYGRNIMANPDIAGYTGSMIRKSFGYSHASTNTVPYTFHTEGPDRNIEYKWTTDTQGTQTSYPDPTRTLSTYAGTLGLGASREAFAKVLLDRGYRQWARAYSAVGAANYVRAGFGLPALQ